MWSLITFLVTYTGFFEHLFLNSQYNRLCPKTTKNTGKTHISFVGSQNVKIQKHTAEYTAGTTFSKRMHVKLVTQTGFFLYLSLKWRHITPKMLCFTSIVEFIAACPLCLHGSAVTIALCHAQSTNSPIARCVNFGLQIPQISETLGG